ncbi:hypothetical protein ACLBXJ_02735 [Methylobacterium mesophilicum]|uniref:hypothetical protein n=1 Tax=Methylobacterium TaxID=407 RepID=UPI001EE2B119|nr:hypothetical protein [Methylobacterium mesophilicum]GJE21788.1 hypothetical protein JHFBIEKO_2236 [Methylobacterium mesophilicum]
MRVWITRGAKDAMSREMLVGLDAAGIGIAAATYDIVGLPPVELAGRRRMGRAASSSEAAE